MNYKPIVVIAAFAIVAVVLSYIVMFVVFPLPQPELRSTIPPTQEPATLVIETPSPEPTPSPYVMCGDYHKVTDRYKTVDGGYYVVIENTTYQIQEAQFDNVTKGDFVKLLYQYDGFFYPRFSETDPYRGYVISDPSRSLTEVSEEESGYRYACRVERVVP